VAGTILPPSPHSSSSIDIIVENDLVLLKNIHNSVSTPILSSRLCAGKRVELQRDYIDHDDILSKGIRDLVSSKKRINYRISEPTLAEYTDLSPRLVTPVSCLVAATRNPLTTSK
jgi:tRNA (adenine57-N1/adenine58-N1)-methyltransferase catalytic subunit